MVPFEGIAEVNLRFVVLVSRYGDAGSPVGVGGWNRDTRIKRITLAHLLQRSSWIHAGQPGFLVVICGDLCCGNEKSEEFGVLY